MEAAFYGDENLSFLDEENRFKTSNKIIADIYSFYDTDGNGFLDPSEVGELIEKWDVNRNGVIDINDIKPNS